MALGWKPSSCFESERRSTVVLIEIMTSILPGPTLHWIGDLTSEQLRAVLALYDRVWPVVAGASQVPVEVIRSRWVREEREILVVWVGETPVATALFFPREIMTADGALRVMALAGVCSAPEFRGRGLGAAVVRAALAQVDRGAFGVALYQTGVPEFYEKLGARRVGNSFANSYFQPGNLGSAEQPWWDPYVMIYPAGYSWPEGPIDLLGEGY
jgi:predicted N-acetyltransferase YhbS